MVKKHPGALKRNLKSVADVRLDCERCTVVVPRSHTDGTYAAIMKRPEVRLATKPKAGEAHFVKLGRHAGVEARSRCLVLRPPLGKSLPHHSVLLLWNSRLVHQGHTMVGANQPRAANGSANAPFDPEILHPKLFDMENKSWLGHLQREGFVALRNVLGKVDVDNVLSHLLKDIQSFSPSASKARSLQEVCKADFPPCFNGMIQSLGMPHSSFAWSVRSHPRVHMVFNMLYPGQVLTGSVDLLCLSPPGTAGSDQRATSKTHEQWLHVDQNKHMSCGDLTMFQGMLSLFTEETLSWGRIAVPICMAPKDHREIAGMSAEKRLLAMCVAGVASTHWPQLGIRHSQGRITLGMVVQGVAKKFKQLPVRLNSAVSMKQAKELRSLSHGELCRRYSVEELRSFVHPEALKFVSEGVCLSQKHDT